MPGLANPLAQQLGTLGHFREESRENRCNRTWPRIGRSSPKSSSASSGKAPRLDDLKLGILRSIGFFNFKLTRSSRLEGAQPPQLVHEIGVLSRQWRVPLH